MCGRYTLTVIEGFSFFEINDRPEILPRFNIAPSQQIPGVRRSPAGGRELAWFQWGWVPRWSPEPVAQYGMINARSETVDRKASFKEAYRQRRCLIPADGFFEWKRQGRSKTAFHIRMRDRSLFAFAGLWERWQGRGDESLESCTILTTEPNDLVVDIHDRMPVILPAAGYADWLDPSADTDQLKGLFRPYPARLMEAVAVSSRVNSPANDDPSCLDPPDEEPQRSLF